MSGSKIDHHRHYLSGISSPISFNLPENIHGKKFSQVSHLRKRSCTFGRNLPALWGR
ncbi:MAG: hypothetical protein IBGAMO2_540011 [Arenicellales bacterium IbO2]|nr:MAG: hypothetical protein IBGAMO2_540011 [Arenicellales bacterium IbO2]